jgi:hypothetical protein
VNIITFWITSAKRITIKDCSFSCWFKDCIYAGSLGFFPYNVPGPPVFFIASVPVLTIRF